MKAVLFTSPFVAGVELGRTARGEEALGRVIEVSFTAGGRALEASA